MSLFRRPFGIAPEYPLHRPDALAQKMRTEDAVIHPFRVRIRGATMRRFINCGLLVGTLSLSFVGCAEKSSTTTEVKVKTPEGTTTETIRKDVEKTGKNPPAAP
jgi:hypothetical protein